MAIVISLLQLFPTILTAVQAVEAAIPLKAAGKSKLDLVLGIVSDVYTSTQQVAPQIPVATLTAFVSQTITRIVATFNALGLFKKSA